MQTLFHFNPEIHLFTLDTETGVLTIPPHEITDPFLALLLFADPKFRSPYQFWYESQGLVGQEGSQINLAIIKPFKTRSRQYNLGEVISATLGELLRLPCGNMHFTGFYLPTLYFVDTPTEAVTHFTLAEYNANAFQQVC